MRTSHGARCTTSEGTEPSNRPESVLIPRLPRTIRSPERSWATDNSASTASPTTTRPSTWGATAAPGGCDVRGIRPRVDEDGSVSTCLSAGHVGDDGRGSRDPGQPCAYVPYRPSDTRSPRLLQVRSPGRCRVGGQNRLV